MLWLRVSNQRDAASAPFPAASPLDLRDACERAATAVTGPGRVLQVRHHERDEWFAPIGARGLPVHVSVEPDTVDRRPADDWSEVLDWCRAADDWNRRLSTTARDVADEGGA